MSAISSLQRLPTYFDKVGVITRQKASELGYNPETTIDPLQSTKSQKLCFKDLLKDAKKCEKTNQLDDAVKILKTADHYFPGRYMCLHKIGIIYAERCFKDGRDPVSDVRQSKNYLYKAINTNSDDPVVGVIDSYYLGKILYDTLKVQEAEAIFEIGVNYSTQLLMSNKFIKLGKRKKDEVQRYVKEMKESRNQCLKELQEQKDSKDRFLKLAKLLEASKDWKNAHIAYSQANHIFEDSHTYHRIAVCLREMGDIEATKHALLKSISFNESLTYQQKNQITYFYDCYFLANIFFTSADSRFPLNSYRSAAAYYAKAWRASYSIQFSEKLKPLVPDLGLLVRNIENNLKDCTFAIAKLVDPTLLEPAEKKEPNALAAPMDLS
jgi:tetratricopeptide (TPR) repeat protein